MAGFAMVLLGLGLRATQLTLVDGQYLRSKARQQQTRMLATQPRRGRILDRTGETLGLTRESVDVFVRPRDLMAGEGDLAQLASLLDLPVDVVQRRVGSKSPFVYLKRRVSPARWARIRRLGIGGVGIENTRERVYPLGPLAGHVVGFTGIDGQGLEGIERQFDQDLRGEPDVLHVVERDGRGRRWLLGGEWEPLSRVGARVELTIDAGIQYVAETELERAVVEFGAKAGTAIVMDPRSGEILAMANAPRFDPNLFASSSPSHWRNRAITDVYEPGSTFKAILAAAGLRAGAVFPEEIIDCEGGAFRVGRRTIHDHRHYDLLSFNDIIAHSSNIGCAKVGARIGSEGLAAAFADFGFRRKTGIRLPGEVSSMIRPASSWRPIDLATASFGQGIAVSPLQLINAFSGIANGGEMMRPYIVRRVIAGDGQVVLESAPTSLGRVIEPDIAAAVTDMLVRVVEEGTGKQSQVPGFVVAGKTGTSQKIDPIGGGYHKTDRIASFVGFVPARDPALTILVVVDTPTRGSTYGGVVAAPVFRRIADRVLRRVGVFPRQDPLLERPRRATPAGLLPATFQPNPNQSESGRATFGAPTLAGAAFGQVTPRFLGMSMRRALVLAQKRGWSVRVEGSGYVVSQNPPAGAPLPDKGPETVLALNFATDR